MSTRGRFFQNMNILTEFMEVDPAEWERRDDYKAAGRRVNWLIVVNDFPDCCVALIQEYTISHQMRESNAVSPSNSGATQGTVHRLSKSRKSTIIAGISA